MIQLISKCHETVPTELDIRSFEVNIKEKKGQEGAIQLSEKSQNQAFNFSQVFC